MSVAGAAGEGEGARRAPLRPAGHRWLLDMERSTASRQADVCAACGMVRMTGFQTGQPTYEASALGLDDDT